MSYLCQYVIKTGVLLVFCKSKTILDIKLFIKLLEVIANFASKN